MLPIKNILSFISFLLLLVQNQSKPLCIPSLDCDSCEYCGLESENYSSCFYRNMFCKDDSKIIFSSYLKEEYSIFYDNEPESYDLCGEVEYELENINDTIILFSSKNKTFPEKNPIRCHYLIDSINKNEEYPCLNIDIKNISNSNETSDLKTNIGIIFTLSDSEIEEVEAITDSELVGKYYINTLKSTTRFEIFLDFEPKKENPDEVLEIKINFGKKFSGFTQKYYKTNYNNEPTTTTSTTQESSSSDSSTLGGAIGGAAGGLIVIIVIFCCCCKTEKRYVEVETTRCALQ